MITKVELDELVKKYETKEFIKNDPIQFPHRGKSKEEIELLGFLASLFAYGNRKIFINKLEYLFKFAEGDIVAYIKNGDFTNLKGFEYRFSKDFDIIQIYKCLNKLYNDSKGLEELFKYGYEKDNMLQVVVDYFYSNASDKVGQGFFHMIPNPKNGGAMQRMNMFLRWMVRKSEVDLGVWNFIKPSELLIPLDVHVARVSRNMGLLRRKSNDFKAVLELTDSLKKFCSEDPIKYDFAMFAFGVELNRKH